MKCPLLHGDLTSCVDRKVSAHFPFDEERSRRSGMNKVSVGVGYTPAQKSE